jgi:hypothetical protein
MVAAGRAGAASSTLHSGFVYTAARHYQYYSLCPDAQFRHLCVLPGHVTIAPSGW